MPRTAIERLGLALILAIPLAIVTLFWRVEVAPGSTASMTERLPGAAQVARGATRPPGGSSGHDVSSDPEMQQTAARLAQRLEREPGDAEGWRTLARTYYVMQRFPEAVAAYERLDALGAPDADVLADWADAAAMAQDRRLEGRPMQLVRRALDADPMQWKALSMAATDALERGDVSAAIERWERALDAVPDGSERASMIRASLAQARQSLASSASNETGGGRNDIR